MSNLLEQIFAAGVVGAGGAGFPTHRKLTPAADTLVVNAAECEPLLASDRYVTRTYAPEITDALLALRGEFGFKRVVVGIKRHYTREVAALKQAFAQKNADFEIFGMDSFYPAGDEQIMIYEITGRVVPPGGIPIAVGVVAQNVTTVLNIYDAMHGRPVTEKFVTVTGAVARPVIVRAPVGTSVADCVRAAGGALGPASHACTAGWTESARHAGTAAPAGFVIKGGPMMGKQFPFSEAGRLVIGKADGGVIVLPEGHPLCVFSQKPVTRIINEAKSVCMQCSGCTEMCPRYLIGHKLRPHIVMRGMASNRDVGDLSEALLCSECGLCELFSCPMQLSPRRVNIHVKGLLREQGIGAADKGVYPGQSDNRGYRKASQSRIAGRLLLRGYPAQIDEITDCVPESVSIPLKHGVGKPSAPVVAVGDKVSAGDVIAKVEFPDVGCLVHASISGVVTRLDEGPAGSITIARERQI